MVTRALMLSLLVAVPVTAWTQDFPKPYSPPCTEREDPSADGFSFTEKPSVRFLGNDKYEIAFAVKGYCDVTVAIVDPKGTVVRHLASGVLGKNAPKPFQKGSLKQKIIWNGFLNGKLVFMRLKRRKVASRLILSTTAISPGPVGVKYLRRKFSGSCSTRSAL